jgi:hypothetical protein
MKKRTLRFQALGFIDLVNQKPRVKHHRLVDQKNKKLGAPSLEVFVLLKAEHGPSTPHTCNKIEKKNWGA